VAASSNLRQEIGALDNNIKAKLLVSHRYVDTSNILVVQARFHRPTNTQQQSWESLHGLRNNGASKKNETINSFENWRQNLVYTLSLDTNFAPFLADGATWSEKTRAEPLHGFTDDGETVPLSRRKTARQKVKFLELMLGQIANYCPIISRNTLLKNSTSIQSVWNMIQEHFGFQITGAHFLDFLNLHLEADEHPEDLFQR